MIVTPDHKLDLVLDRFVDVPRAALLIRCRIDDAVDQL